MADAFAHGYSLIYGAEAFEGLFVQRGWSMRHGRRKRLAAQLQDAGGVATLHGGIDLCRGRSVFKRSANRGQRTWSSSHSEQRSSASVTFKKRYLQEDYWQQAIQQSSSASEWLEELQWDALVETEFDESWCAWCEEHSVEGARADLVASEVADDACSTCASTVASTEEACPSPRLKKFEKREYDRHLSRWEMAVLMAEEAAKGWCGQPARAAEAVRAVARAKRGKKETEERFEGWEEHRALREVLASSCQVTTTYTEPGRGSFEEFRFNFFKHHALTFCTGLQSCLGYPVVLHATRLSTDVEQRFHAACKGELQGTLVPALHGTHENNLGGIFQQGLVVPGRGNSVSVANGSVHGVGIYTASMSNPSMSRGYARGSDPPVLVCGVLDSSVEKEVKHAGGALVVFDERRVAPLFVARRGAGKNSLPSPPLPRPRRIREIQPPTTFRRGPAKKPRKQQARLFGVAGFLSRQAKKHRIGPLDLRSSLAAYRFNPIRRWSRSFVA